MRSVLRALVAHGADPRDPRRLAAARRLEPAAEDPRSRSARISRRAARRYVWSRRRRRSARVRGGRVVGVRCASGRELVGDAVVLATGHSARDVYELLHAARRARSSAKPFAIGVRVEHPQPLIDRIQYGRALGHPRLPAAFYQLTATVPTPTPASAASTASACARAAGSSTRRPSRTALVRQRHEPVKRRDSPFANAGARRHRRAARLPRPLRRRAARAASRCSARSSARAFEAGGGALRRAGAAR